MMCARVRFSAPASRGSETGGGVRSTEGSLLARCLLSMKTKCFPWFLLKAFDVSRYQTILYGQLV